MDWLQWTKQVNWTGYSGTERLNGAASPSLTTDSLKFSPRWSKRINDAENWTEREPVVNFLAKG